MNKKEEYIEDIINEEFWRLAEKYGVQISEELITKEDEVKMDSSKIKEMNEANKNVNFKAMYRYEGIPAERSFCKRMLRLDKFYTKEEINIMSFKGTNRKFGHNGRNYSIFDMKGGKYCKHRWIEYAVTYENGKITQAVDMGAAPGKAGQKASASNNYWAYN